MLETKSALSRPLVIGHGRDGRCRYDPIAKQALEHGVNASLLRKWINHYLATARGSQTDDSGPALPAFMPLSPTMQN
jgi:transposase